ncbi:TraR/DksA family transcriptional regulator [Ktedonobacter racemifer]|uniref:Transcriptional regulator, TraR/DksA family n=1 Tax=Ktedonobacter racemifer DSM 44963 TaxID=485913 RepID=D6U7I1_KTERA|nr:TraR/DksA C4-type zinc finger protein [Ktedonobacter racemifer]EFH79842.1 transcriptional regulator, TraR/DksA family [Ktedonobacter racemifer DSM 44963]
MALDLQQIKERLQAKEKEILERIKSLVEPPPPEPVDPIQAQASEGPQEFEDLAVDVQQDEQVQAIIAHQQALLQEVRNALKRLEDGTYGRCIDCGQPIPEKRLEAIPWAARCIQDEEKAQRSGLGS